MTVSTTTFSIMTQKVKNNRAGHFTFNNETLRIMTDSIMTVSITIISIMTQKVKNNSAGHYYI